MNLKSLQGDIDVEHLCHHAAGGKTQLNQQIRAATENLRESNEASVNDEIPS